MQFANTKTSQDHYSSSHNLKCSKCSEVFDNSDNLEVHEAEHGLKKQGSSNAGEPVSTEIQIIDFDLDFENPVNSQASLDLGFKCSDCELTFATESGLDIHQLGAHPTVRFLLPFIWLFALINFLYTTIIPAGPSISCPHCYYTCNKLTGLLQHNTSLHLEKCYKCEAIFESQKDLIKHLETMHPIKTQIVQTQRYCFPEE